MVKTHTIETFEDILNALRERKDWLEELRRIILTEELLQLPQKFEKLRKDFDDFRENEFLPLKKKVDKIEKDVEVLKQDVEVLKRDVEVLKRDVEVLKQDVEALKKDVKALKNDVADLKGDNFERKVSEKAPTYFGKIIKRCKLINNESLANLLDDAEDRGVITEDERVDAINIDVVVTGLLRSDPTKKLMLVTEVSLKADQWDVQRAHRRAKTIQKATDTQTLAVVIGKEYTEDAKSEAQSLGVLLL